MQRNRKVFIGKCAAILAVPALIIAYQNGPPVGVSGVPGESQCSQAGCHVGTTPSAGGGVAISLSGGGQTYSPGAPQTVTITINEPAGANFHGFQATARRVSDLKQSAGTLSGAGLLSLCGSTDLTVEIPKPTGGCSGNTPLEFISHAMPQSSNTFTFTWTPPASDVGEVRIFAAANAANGNGQNTGDRIYTANVTLAPQASGGPRPSISSVEVDGSFRPGIVAGSWIAIKGTDLAPTPNPGRIWNAATEIVDGRLPTSLDAVSVNINGKPAAVYFVSGTQINVQAPADDAVGPVEVEVVRNGVRSEAFRANLEQYVPGFFMFDPEGRKYIAGVHADGTLLGKASLYPTLTLRPAAPGNTVLLFGTGFGPTNPPVQTGVVFNGAASTTQPVRITIGGMEATVPFAGLSGAGLYQFNAVVPDLPNGDHAVIAEIGGVRSPENAFITIQR